MIDKLKSRLGAQAVTPLPGGRQLPDHIHLETVMSADGGTITRSLSLEQLASIMLEEEPTADLDKGITAQQWTKILGSAKFSARIRNKLMQLRSGGKL